MYIGFRRVGAVDGGTGILEREPEICSGGQVKSGYGICFPLCSSYMRRGYDRGQLERGSCVDCVGPNESA